MMHRPTRLLAGALAAGLLLAACGDDGDDDATGAVDETVMDETTTSAMDEEMDDTGDEMDEGAEEMESADIVDTAASADGFTTLLSAVEAAGLEETLRGEGPFTVFAPTDDAFDALPEGTLDSLLEEPEGQLADILTYHVVEGEVLAEDVAGLDGEEVTTVNGATFAVAVADDGTVTLTDATGNEVTVTQTDIQASNGVIHVLDGVLLPG